MHLPQWSRNFIVHLLNSGTFTSCAKRLQFSGMETLWAIALGAMDDDIALMAIKLLNMLHENVCKLLWFYFISVDTL